MPAVVFRLTKAGFKRPGEIANVRLFNHTVMLAGNETDIHVSSQTSPAAIVASRNRERRIGRPKQGKPTGVVPGDITVSEHHVVVEDPLEIVEDLVGDLHGDTRFNQSQLQGVLP